MSGRYTCDDDRKLLKYLIEHGDEYGTETLLFDAASTALNLGKSGTSLKGRFTRELRGYCPKGFPPIADEDAARIIQEYKITIDGTLSQRFELIDRIVVVKRKFTREEDTALLTFIIEKGPACRDGSVFNEAAAKLPILNSINADCLKRRFDDLRKKHKIADILISENDAKRLRMYYKILTKSEEIALLTFLVKHGDEHKDNEIFKEAVEVKTLSSRSAKKLEKSFETLRESYNLSPVVEGEDNNFINAADALRLAQEHRMILEESVIEKFKKQFPNLDIKLCYVVNSSEPKEKTAKEQQIPVNAEKEEANLEGTSQGAEVEESDVEKSADQLAEMNIEK